MGRPGRKRRLALEDEFFTLVGNGMSVSGAARPLGIPRTTALNRRRRYGGAQRERVPEDARSSRYLSLIERERLTGLRRDGHGIRVIARRLTRSASTISRELRRNMLPGDRGVYDAGLAHARSRQNAKRTRRSVFAHDRELRQVVQPKLELQWSPEQIAAWLRSEHPCRTAWHVCHETIYQGLYLGGPNGLARALARHLRTGRGLRLPRRPAKGRRPRFAIAAKLIDERPVVVEERSRIGDFEGDLIIGHRGESAIATLVDRRTRLVKLVRLSEDRRSETVAPPSERRCRRSLRTRGGR